MPFVCYPHVFEARQVGLGAISSHADQRLVGEVGEDLTQSGSIAGL